MVNACLNDGRFKCYNGDIMAADTSDTAPQRPGAPQKPDRSLETLVAITGDTYPLRAQLKAMGAVWDSAGRVWKIAPERAPQAQALVEHQPAVGTAPSPAAAPPAAVPGRNHATYETDPLADLADPFEESQASVPLVALSGNTYPVKEALKALGAHCTGTKNNAPGSLRRAKPPMPRPSSMASRTRHPPPARSTTRNEREAR